MLNEYLVVNVEQKLLLGTWGARQDTNLSIDQIIKHNIDESTESVRFLKLDILMFLI